MDKLPLSIYSSMSSNDQLCRACLDFETPENKMLSPCKCTGSIEYIHEECLKKWILSKSSDPKSSSCEICQHEFKMEVHTKKILLWNKIIELFFHLAPTLSILFFILYKGFIFIWYELNLGSLLFVKLLVFGLSIFLLAGFFFTGMAIRQDILNKIFETRVISWNILNYTGKIRQEVTRKKGKVMARRRRRKLVKVVV